MLGFYTYGILTFDFGRRSTLPHRGRTSVAERKALFGDGVSYKSRPGYDLNLRGDCHSGVAVVE